MTHAITPQNTEITPSEPQHMQTAIELVARSRSIIQTGLPEHI